MKRTQTEQTLRRNVVDVICVAVLIVYFLHFSLAALHGGFREDEMGNIGIYWRAGAFKSLLANVAFWTLVYVPGGALYDLPLYLYRPGGALYYLPLYHFFALNPLPYRIVHISILAASIPLVYYLGRCLTSSRSIAFLAALALCYHPRLAALVFINSFIFDVLCGLFYFAALTYYIHIRESEMRLRRLQLLGFLTLYVCALNCKEMAVTLPVIVLIYELLRSPRWVDWKGFFHWSWSSAAPPLIAGLLTALYIYGKTHSSGALIGLDPYRPRYSWHHFMTINAQYLGDVLFTQHGITPTTLLVLWAVVFVYAFMRRNRTLQLMGFWVVIVPLPIAFIPPRSNACFYLVLFGWAMIFATVTFDLITLIFKSGILFGRDGAVSAATGTTIREATAKMSSRFFRIVAVVLVTFAFAMFTEYENQRLGVPRAQIGVEMSHSIEVLRSLDLHPSPGSSVLLLLEENLFQNKWNAFFMASLVWNDRSLRIWVEDVNQATPEQFGKIDYVVSISRFQAKVIRSPETLQAN